MIIIGCSPYANVGTSCSLAALAYMDYEKKGHSVLLIQGQWAGNLEGPLLGKRKAKQEAYFAAVGMDEVIRLERAGHLDGLSLVQSTIALEDAMGRFDFLSGTTKVRQNLYETSFLEAADGIFHTADQAYDRVYVDVDYDMVHLLAPIVNQVFVFLPHNYWKIRSYFSSELPFSNIRYLIANFEQSSIFQVFSLKYRFPQLMKHSIGDIPHEITYQDAWSRGKVISYLKLHSQNRKKEAAGKFIKALENLLETIEKESTYAERKKRALV